MGHHEKIIKENNPRSTFHRGCALPAIYQNKKQLYLISFDKAKAPGINADYGTFEMREKEVITYNGFNMKQINFYR